MKKKIALILAIVLVLSTLTACKKKYDDPLMEKEKEELVQMIHSLQDSEMMKQSEIDSLKDKITGVYGSDTKKPAISQFETDDSGRFTLNKNDGTITFPTGLAFPNSEQSYNVSSIMLMDDVTIKPSSNWEIILDGTSIKLCHHDSGIAGVFQISKHDAFLPSIFPENLKSELEKFFVDVPAPETVLYQKVFLGSTEAGCDGSSHTYIDEKDCRIRAGFVESGSINIAYLFSYEGEIDSSKEELILNLLSTLKVSGANARLEK